MIKPLNLLSAVFFFKIEMFATLNPTLSLKPSLLKSVDLNILSASWKKGNCKISQQIKNIFSLTQTSQKKLQWSVKHCHIRKLDYQESSTEMKQATNVKMKDKFIFSSLFVSKTVFLKEQVIWYQINRTCLLSFRELSCRAGISSIGELERIFFKKK